MLAERFSIQATSAALVTGFGVGFVSVSPSKNHLPSSETYTILSTASLEYLPVRLIL